MFAISDTLKTRITENLVEFQKQIAKAMPLVEAMPQNPEQAKRVGLAETRDGIEAIYRCGSAMVRLATLLSLAVDDIELELGRTEKDPG